MKTGADFGTWVRPVGKHLDEDRDDLGGEARRGDSDFGVVVALDETAGVGYDFDESDVLERTEDASGSVGEFKPITAAQGGGFGGVREFAGSFVEHAKGLGRRGATAFDCCEGEACLGDQELALGLGDGKGNRKGDGG